MTTLKLNGVLALELLLSKGRNGDFMKAIFSLLILIFALGACGAKKFSSQNDILSQDDNTFDFPDDSPNDDGPQDPLHCPRYNLIISSTHQNTATLNYEMTLNTEMKKLSTEGEITVLFQQDSSRVRYTQCSGKYVNTSILTNLNPLQMTEDLTRQVLINVGRVCTQQVPVRTTTIQVVDTTNGKIMFDEAKLRQDLGSCEFDYTDSGKVLRNQLMQFSDSIVSAKAFACNK